MIRTIWIGPREFELSELHCTFILHPVKHTSKFYLIIAVYIYASTYILEHQLEETTI